MRVMSDKVDDNNAFSKARATTLNQIRRKLRLRLDIIEMNYHLNYSNPI